MSDGQGSKEVAAFGVIEYDSLSQSNLVGVKKIHDKQSVKVW
jgi:hypothetical protein